MKNLKKTIALGLATTAVVSAMSMTALANYDDTAYASLPTLSKVDTSKASRENPVTYVDEKTGATVTIYDPNITVDFRPFDLYDLQSQRTVLAEGFIYVPYSNGSSFGGATKSFEAPSKGPVQFALTTFNRSKFNVSLNEEGVTGSPLAIVKNQPVGTAAILTGVEEGGSYEFRVSSYEGDGNATYTSFM